MSYLLSRSQTELIEEVARNLRPAPAIRTAADAIVAALTAGGAAFNGIHLRMEADADFQDAGGGDEARSLCMSLVLLILASSPSVGTSGDISDQTRGPFLAD